MMAHYINMVLWLQLCDQENYLSSHLVFAI